MPKASVLVTIHNAELYLAEALRSVVMQTFTDFECLLLDDGSTDGSKTIAEQFAAEDSRFKVYSWPNQGIPRSLNKGIELALGEIIIRMDADDICRSTRFEKQISYLDANPDCVAVGSRICMIDDKGLPIREFIDVFDHEEIDAVHLRGNGFGIASPASAVPRLALAKIGGFNKEYKYAQDLDLFLRLAEVGKLANLSEVLLDYRTHSKSISSAYKLEQLKFARRAINEARMRRGMPILIDATEAFEKRDDLASVHRRLAWWALSNTNIRSARIHAWRAFKARPFDSDNLRVLACALRGR